MAIVHTDADAVAIAARLGNVPSFSWQKTALNLRACPGGDAGQYVYVRQCSDAAPHLFKWDAASVAADDGVNVIKCTAVAVGRWLNADTDQHSTSIPAGYVKDDGTVPFIAEQAGIDPTADSSLTTKRYVDTLVASKSFVLCMVPALYTAITGVTTYTYP